MLRANLPLSSGTDFSQGMTGSIQPFMRVLRRQKLVILGVAGLLTGLAALYSAMATPRFTATAQMLIDSQQARSLDVGGSNAGGMDDAMLDSQVEVIKSERIAAGVIRDLKLYELARDAREKQQSEFSLRRVLGSFLPFLSNSAPISDYDLQRNIIDGFRSNLAVARVGKSYVIGLSYKSADPQLAAQVANQVAEVYIVDQLESKYQATRRASVWLQERINELRQQALAAERAVQDFKAKNNIINTGSGLVSDQQLSEQSSQLTQARAQVAAMEARVDRIQKILAQGAATGTSDETVSDVLESSVITRLRTQYLDAAKREADWSKRYGPDHSAVLNLREEMKGLQRAIFTELSRFAETFKSDLQIAKAREASLSRSVDELVAQTKLTGQAQVELRELESSAQSYRTLYDNFLQRFMQQTQQQSFPITEARLITDAAVPRVPSEPKTALIVLGGLMFGLMAGLGAAFWREHMNSSFRSPSDVEQYLGLDALGVLPAFSKNVGGPPQGESAFDYATGPLRQMLTDPFSRYTETLRSVKVSADLSILGRSIKVIGIASTLPQEGKSTVAANFAQLIAHSGARTYLVDGDLRSPTLTHRLAPKRKTGLLELVMGTVTLEDVTVIDPMTQLRFVPAVVPRHVVHTNEIIGSKEMQRVIDEIKQHADYIIIDLPPLAPVVDVMASTHLVDGYVFVVEWAKTPRNLVVSTLQNSGNVYEKVLGCLLNKVDIKAMRSLEDYGGKYYHYKYRYSYGRDD